MLKLVSFRSEPKMPAEVAICLGHSPEWKSYTQSMFDIKVPNVYKSDRARIPRSRSISVKKCATLQNQVQNNDTYPLGEIMCPRGGKVENSM